MPNTGPSRRPLIGIAIAYLLLLCAAFGTGGLWAVYVAQLGGSPTAVGIFNAAGNLAAVAATLLSGWLADRLARRKELFYVSCVLFAGTWWLMTRAITWQQLTLINVIGGFTFGVAINMIVILTGLLAGETERGRSFGLLTLMVGLSMLVSGLVSGPIADRWGFPTLFMFDVLLCLACLIPGLLFTEPARAPTKTAERPAVRGRGLAGLGRSFYLLTAATFIVTFACFGGSLGRSIAMSQLGFSATAISLTTAIGGAISLPTPLIFGWLSDRIGRKRLLWLSLAAGFVSLLALAFAGSAWSFWAASALFALIMSAQPLMQAWATDLLPVESVGIGLSLLSGAASAGLFVSSLGIGAAIQQMGARPAFLLTALTSLIAIGLLLPVHERDRRQRDADGHGDPG